MRKPGKRANVWFSSALVCRGDRARDGVRCASLTAIFTPASRNQLSCMCEPCSNVDCRPLDITAFLQGTCCCRDHSSVRRCARTGSHAEIQGAKSWAARGERTRGPSRLRLPWPWPRCQRLAASVPRGNGLQHWRLALSRRPLWVFTLCYPCAWWLAPCEPNRRLCFE